MLQDIELKRLGKAIEFLYAGMDITKITAEQYSLVPSNGSLAGAGATTFCITFDKGTQEFLQLTNPHLYRKGRSYSNVSDKYLADEHITSSITVSKEILFSTMKVLKETGIDTYNKIDEVVFNPELLKELEEIRKSWDYTKAFDCEIKNKLKISDTELEFKALVALTDYPQELPVVMYNAYMSKRNFVLKSFKDFEITDNRIIIPLSKADKYDLKAYLKLKEVPSETIDNLLKMDAIVISKNPLDYFYCSYGNSFQSCYALNSSYKGWYGYLPFCVADESFIVYGTSGKVVKTGIISGTKFHQPQMFWRTWGYADDNGNLLIDKKYRGSGRAYDNLIEYCCRFLTDNFGVICDRHGAEERALWNDGRGIGSIWDEYDLKFYSDSLNIDDGFVSFQYGQGSRGNSNGYIPEWMRKFDNFIKYSSTVTSISKDLDISKPSTVVKGVLMNPHLCPITNLYIPISEKQHYFAKYLKEPVKNCCILTYINGTVFTDASTYLNKNTSDGCLHIATNKGYTREWHAGNLYTADYTTSSTDDVISLKTLKEFLKGNIKDSGFDAIILRIVEEDRVTVQVFKKGK